MKYIISIIILGIVNFCSRLPEKKTNYIPIYDFKLTNQVILPLPNDIQKYNINGCKLFSSETDSILIIPFISSKRILIY